MPRKKIKHHKKIRIVVLYGVSVVCLLLIAVGLFVDPIENPMRLVLSMGGIASLTGFTARSLQSNEDELSI